MFVQEQKDAFFYSCFYFRFYLLVLLVLDELF